MFWSGIAEGIFTRTPFGFETRDFLNLKSIFSVLYFKKLLPLLGKRNGTLPMHALSISPHVSLYANQCSFSL